MTKYLRQSYQVVVGEHVAPSLHPYLRAKKAPVKEKR